MAQVTYQDVLKYSPINFKYLTEKKWMGTFRDSNYYPIIKSLIDGLKTAEEIYEEYPQGKKKKSDTTIYRYIKDLIKEEIVIEYGRRLRSDNVASKKIYGLTAKLLIPTNDNYSVWKSERSQEVADKIAGVMSHNFDNKVASSSLKDIFLNFEETNNQLELEFLNKLFNEEQINDFFSKSDPSIKDYFQKGFNDIFKFNREDILVFFNLIRWILWFLQNNNYKSLILDLKEIFVKNPDLKSKDEASNKNSSSSLTNSTDLISYTQPSVYFGNWDQMLLTYDSLYHGAIFELLKYNPPMTIKEIHEQHLDSVNRRIERTTQKCKIIGEPLPDEFKKAPEKKVENTVYRYVKDLIDSGLVVEAGRRIDPDSPTTSILYTARSKQTIFFEDTDEYWKSDNWNKVMRSFGFAVALYLDKTNLKHEKFLDILTEIEKNKFNSFRSSLEREANADKMMTFLKKLHYSELNAALKIIGLIEWLLNTKKVTEIRNLLNSTFI